MSTYPRRLRFRAHAACVFALAAVIRVDAASAQSKSPGEFTYQSGWPASCSAGLQSPVTFVGTHPTSRSDSVAFFSGAPRTSVGVHAHTADFAFTQAAAGWMRVGAARYALESFHFHFPVEHQLPNASGHAPASATFELHIKTKDARGQYAIFAVQFVSADSGMRADSGFFAAVVDGIDLIDTRKTIAIPMPGILAFFSTMPFYSYIGTTTSPNCDPNVTWYVLSLPLTVKASVVAAMHAALEKKGLDATNARLMTFDWPHQSGMTLITPKR
ncbi:MAG TPA: carbonic anhydrase family protein [Gemmatimonadaceae bacterium]|nr:carbonic anhydrase family protein [Gemmatimonadaceae bacterium]